MTEMPEPTRYGEVIWLEPFPDVLLEGIPDEAPGPEARYRSLLRLHERDAVHLSLPLWGGVRERLAPITGGIRRLMSQEPVVIVPYQDGPYLVRGPVVLRDQEGRSISVSRRTVALCRCGKSRMRPFCDGTHHVINFHAASAAERPPTSVHNGVSSDGADLSGGET